MAGEEEGGYFVEVDENIGPIEAAARAVDAIDELSGDYDLEFRDNSFWLSVEEEEYRIDIDTEDAPVIRLDPDEGIDKDEMDEFYDDFVDAI